MNDYSSIADLYDSYVTDTADHGFWSRCAVEARGPILELAAGTGRATVALGAASGRKLLTLDRAPRMLQRLLTRFRDRPGAVLAVAGDMAILPFPAERFGLVVIPFNALGEVVEVPKRAAVLRELARVLAPDGRAVVTLHNPACRRQTLDAELHRLGPFPLGDRRLEVLVRGRLLQADLAESEQTYRVLDRTDQVLEERRVTLRFALPDAASLITMATEAGLTVQALYGDYDQTPYVAESSPFILAVMGRAPTLRAA
jgi:SAM-dependent methyltransferase